MNTLATIRHHYKLIGLFLLFGVGYVWLSLIHSSNRPVLVDANLTPSQIIVLILAVVLPYVGIWLVGLIGYMRLYDYAALIRRTEDGQILKKMALGIFGVLVSLPVMSINNTLAQVLLTEHYEHATIVRRVGTYTVIAILLWSFYTLMRSTQAMLIQARHAYRPLPRIVAILGLFLGGLYIYFVLTNPLFDNLPKTGTLPVWAVIDTIVLPRLLAWFWGVHAVWNLYQYARVVPGKIYRLAFSYLALGVGVVTVTIILLQYLQAISVVTQLPIGVILLLVYLILVLASAGFLMVARGARELLRIEEA